MLHRKLALLSQWQGLNLQPSDVMLSRRQRRPAPSFPRDWQGFDGELEGYLRGDAPR